MGLFSDIVSPIADLLGGHLNRKEARSQQDQNEAMQREFAQSGIRWRVADAEAAGVHPLFALGGGGASFVPSPSSANYDEVGRIGQHARQASMDREARALQEEQIAVLRSEVGKNNAQADLFASEAARNRQSNESSSPFPDLSTDQGDYAQKYMAMWGKMDPHQVFNPLSSAVVRSAGIHADDIRGGPEERILVDHDPSVYNPEGKATPFYQRYDMGHGTVYLPSIGQQGNVMEGLEGLDDAKIWAAVVAENTRRGTLKNLLATYNLTQPSKEATEGYRRQFHGHRKMPF